VKPYTVWAEMSRSTEDPPQSQAIDGLLDQRQRLLDKWPSDGDAAVFRSARSLRDNTERLVGANQGLVTSIANRFSAVHPEHREDYLASGMVGLLEAIQTFDPEKGTWSSWAAQSIRNAVLRAVRDAEFPHLKMYQFLRRGEIRKFLSDQHASADDVGAVAEYLGISYEEAVRLADEVGLEYIDDLNFEEIEFLLADPVDDFADPEGPRYTADEVNALRDLTPEELFVVIQRDGLESGRVSLRNIGDTLGKSREAIRQIYLRAERSLKDARLSD